MKIFKKLSLIVLSSAVLLGGVGLVSLRANNRIKANVYQAVLEGNNTRNLLANIQQDLTRLQFKTYQYFSPKKSGVSAASLKDSQQEILELATQVERQLLQLDKLSESLLLFEVNEESKAHKTEIEKEVSLIKIVEKLQEKNIQLKGIIQELLKSNNLEVQEQLFSDKLTNLLNNEIYFLLQEYHEIFSQEQQEKTQIVEKYLDNNNLIIGSATEGALLFSLLLGFYTILTISRPIEQLKRAAILVGKGDLNVRVPSVRDDEIGILAQTFNQMLLGLSNTTVSKSYVDKIFSSLSDSLIVLAKNGTIKKVNPATCHLLGYPENELLEKNFQLILADSSLDIENLTPTKVQSNFEVTYLSKEGKTIPIAFSSSLIQNQQGEIEGIVCLGRDISEKQNTEKALRESEERYALASHATNDGLWDWNVVSNQIYFSPRWKSLLGYEEQEFSNDPNEWFKRVHPDYAEQVSQEIIEHLNNSISHFEITYPMRHKDGNYRWMLCRGMRVKNKEGKIYRLVGSQTDVTQSYLAQEKLRSLALYDELTGLPNRSFFLEQLSNLFELHKKGQAQMFAVLFLDLDAFKKINDSLGHLMGDKFLRAFTRRLKECLRREDLLARLGGDEFAILVVNMPDISDATNLAERIFQDLNQPFDVQGRELFISVSIGIAPSINNYDQVENFLRDADTAMYRAKAAGKGCYAVFQPQMYQEEVSKLELENDLRRAIEREEFQVFYQPIVKLTNRQIIGFEALVRWQHPEKGMVSPGKFIPIAEETGLILPIGYWVMEEACRQLRQWQSQYQVAENLTISVNLSPIQLNYSRPDNPYNCLEKINSILKITGLKSRCLKLEITETTIMESLNKTTSLLQQIKALGIKLSMDDFGTGYSSLNYLHHLPLDTLKIDRSFIKELAVNSDKLALTRTIVNLAQSLRMDTIAEGVETREQQTLLRELNCEYGQGYLFSKPVSSTDAEILIATMEQLTKGATGSLVNFQEKSSNTNFV